MRSSPWGHDRETAVRASWKALTSSEPILLKFSQISSLSDGDGLKYRSIPHVSQPPWPGVQVDGATHSNPVRADVCTDCG